jgi:hydroxymethylbilane synthase
VLDIRGNVDTRLGREEAITEILEWPTAPGQGALAIEVRAGDEKLVSALDHRPTRTTTTAERRVLAILEAGCSAPVGAQAQIDDGLLFLSARVYATDGSDALTSSHALYLDDSSDPAEDVAQRVAAELLQLGAGDLL